MKKLLLSTAATLFFSITSFCQTVDILTNPSATSVAALGGSRNYNVNECIYTEAEIGATNFISASTAIDIIGFYNNVVGAPTSFNNVNIYMMNVPAGTTTFSTGAYSLIGYTKVFDYTIAGAIVVSSTGLIEIPLTTTFTRVAGTNLQVLVERTDNVAHTSFSWRTSLGSGINSAALSTRQYFSLTTAPVSGTTILTAAASRSQIRLKHILTNDAGIGQIYTLGKLPISNAIPHIVTGTITNLGTSTLINLPVTLTVSSVNSFTNVQNISSLAPGATTTVSFASYTPTTIGSDNINVSVPADDNNANNSSSISQVVNTNTWSYSQGTVASGSGGLAGNTIDLASKYYNSAATSIAQVSAYFSAVAQPYKIAIWDATGVGGSPGSLLFETTIQTSTIGENITPILPAFAVPIGNYYVGVRQTNTTNFNLSRQTETPLRAATFYYVVPSGGSGWIDNSTGSTNRFMIDPKLQIPIDAFVSNIGLPNPGNITCTNTSETITAKLTNVGSSSIAANAATITLKITGANPQIITTTNTALIASGSFETINFTGVNLSNPGTNFDTVYVSLAGDVEQANDTTKVTQIIATRNVALETVVANYPLTPNCDDMGWTYYRDADNKNVLAVEWGTNTASKAAATASLTLDAADYTATAGSGVSATGTFTMKRYWNVDVAGVQPTTPVNVRFFYDAAEKTATDAAALAFQTANAGSNLETPNWFKTTTGAFVGDALHVTATQVLNAIPLTNVNTGAATINGVLYAQFNGITSFSGGTYAAGVGTGTVLPISIEFFKGKKLGTTNYIDWKVSCTNEPSLTLTLERSIDGRNFKTLNDQSATATRCLQGFDFTDVSPLAGANYYRLKLTSTTGKIYYSTIVVLLNKEKGFELISVAPNPTKNLAILTLTSVKAGNINIVITDIAGKVVAKQTVNVIAGNNPIDMNFVTLGAGTYTIAATNTEGEIKTTRFVKY
jgi:Secretion system C-terminal sorting domain